ncbi:MAG TPA: sensor histidine kinase [Lysobacter sp.]|nr:sensor histidine kinase [Lysobacter sp.]
MLSRLNHSRLLRYAGLFTWGAVGLWLLNVWLDPAFLPPEPGETVELRILRWLAVYVVFGVVYWWITRSLGQRRPSYGDHALLLVLTACAIGVTYFSGTGLGSILLMVLAGLLPWLLPLRVAVPWLIGSNLATIPLFVQLDFTPALATVQALGYMGFSSFVFVTALVARQQAEAREEQRRLNAELRATRALLGESVRVNERTRISRELHDLLGHHLTALSLNLEVAGHLAPEGRAREHVQQAHTLAKLLLTDVREAVSQLREGGAIDLAAALQPLSENVPAIDIHMDIETPLTLDDPERAHVLLRCTQEIITNAVRHAQAHNLWINARREGCNIIVDARDDGRGADALVAGNGLRGMRERLAQYGGELRIDTQPRPHPEAGFRLRLTLPASATLAASEGAIA